MGQETIVAIIIIACVAGLFVHFRKSVKSKSCSCCSSKTPRHGSTCQCGCCKH